MSISKIFGWVLLIAGVAIIGGTLVFSYNIFTGKAQAPAIFEMPKTQVKATAPKGSVTSLEDVQGQLQTMLGEQLKNVLPLDALPKMLNLGTWGMLAWILFSGASHLAGLGIKLLKQ